MSKIVNRFTDLLYDAEIYNYSHVRPLFAATFSGERAAELLENFDQLSLVRDFGFPGIQSEKVLNLFYEVFLELKGRTNPGAWAKLDFLKEELISLDYCWIKTNSISPTDMDFIYGSYGQAITDIHYGSTFAVEVLKTFREVFTGISPDESLDWVSQL